MIDNDFGWHVRNHHCSCTISLSKISSRVIGIVLCFHDLWWPGPIELGNVTRTGSNLAINLLNLLRI